VESSFGPCSLCTKLQDCLRHQGQHIIQLCHQSNVPSTLAHHRCLKNTKPEWLTADDLQQWSDNQSKDFDCLTKHVDALSTSLSKTKSDLKASESQCKKHEENSRRLQQLINEDKQSKKILQEIHDKKIMDLKKELEQQTSQLNGQVKMLTVRLTKLDGEVKDLNEECRTKTEQIERLGNSKTISRINCIICV
jgi:chromosome segregation ATPase